MAASAVRPAKTEYDAYYERYISLVPDEDVLVTLDLQLSETLILLRSLATGGGSTSPATIARNTSMLLTRR